MYDRARESSSAAADSACPVPEEYRGNLGVYNVYNTKIDAAQPSTSSDGDRKNERRGIASWFGLCEKRHAGPNLQTPVELKWL